MNRGGVQSGFTLLEMLVAMTLLAFIVVAGQQAIALAARAAVPIGDDGNAFLVRHQIMDWVETSIPVRTSRRDRAALMFAGEPNRLRFVTSLPERFGVAGPHLVTLSRAPGQNGGLLVTWQAVRPPRNSGVGGSGVGGVGGGIGMAGGIGAGGPDAPVGERLMLEGVQGVGFRYWDGSANAGWLDTWPAPQRLPAMIQMIFEGGSAEGWPPMMVALRNRGG